MSDQLNHAGFVRKSTEPLIFKSTGALAPLEATPQGRITIVANSTNVEDLQRDKVMPRAWAGVIASRQSPRLMIGHDVAAIPVGKALSLTEWLPGDPRLPAWHAQNNAGALVGTFQLNMKSPRGQEFYTAVAGGFLSQFSVGFLAGSSDKTYKNGVTEINNVELLAEVSGVVHGASPGTQALDAKAYGSRSMDPIAATVEQYLRDEPEFARWAVSHPDQAVDLIVARVNQQLDRGLQGRSIPRPERSEPTPTPLFGDVDYFRAMQENYAAARANDLPVEALIRSGIPVSPPTFREELEQRNKNTNR